MGVVGWLMYFTMTYFSCARLDISDDALLNVTRAIDMKKIYPVGNSQISYKHIRVWFGLSFHISYRAKDCIAWYITGDFSVMCLSLVTLASVECNRIKITGLCHLTTIITLPSRGDNKSIKHSIRLQISNLCQHKAYFPSQIIECFIYFSIDVVLPLRYLFA